MSSHIHELWQELELPEQYPELDPDRILARVNGALEQEEPPRSTKSPMKRHVKLFTILAAALVLMTGTAFAAAYQLGLLELFFPDGDTSQLEPYVQDTVGSAENEDYRFTVNSALYDGQNIYTVVTVEALNDQAADDLMSNRVFAEAHREDWGDDMVDSLLSSGSTGPNGILYSSPVSEDGMYLRNLPNPNENSRSWQISIFFRENIGPQDDPLSIWLIFMGREYAVEIPLDIVLDSIRLTPNEEVLVSEPVGLRGILTEFVLTPTSFNYIVEEIGDWPAQRGEYASPYYMTELENPFFLRMKDGSVLTRSQLGVLNRNFSTPVDLTQVASIIYGDREFPVDGSPSSPADIDSHLYPFSVEYPPYTDPDFVYQNQISFRLLCQGLGAYYTWDETSQTASATYRGVTITAALGDNTLYVDGQPVEMTWRNWSAREPDQDDPPLLPNAPSASTLDGDLLVPVEITKFWTVSSYLDRTWNEAHTAIDKPRSWIITP